MRAERRRWEVAATAPIGRLSSLVAHPAKRARELESTERCPSPADPPWRSFMPAA